MLTLIYKKMKYGYHILIGTVNPLSFGSLVNFYIDPTHKRPIHPLTLEFLLGSANFREIKTEFFANVSADAKLRKIEIGDYTADKEKNFIGIFNRNIDMLNEVIYGPQGYVVVGKK
jgi:O-antigen chain-terminating methyltransferase